MNNKTFCEFLIQHHFKQEQIDLLFQYKNLIQQYNKIHNLSRIIDEDNIYDSFFVESILPFLKINFKPLKDASLIDIGSGNGNPGIILKILYPQLDVTLLEANNKKCILLNNIVQKLGLDIKIIHGRAEDVIHNNNYEQYDYVTSRAVAKLINLLEISIGFAKITGLLIEPKGLNGLNEYEEAKIFCIANNIELITNLAYKYNEKQNIVFVFKKMAKTNRNIPRSWKQIIKANGK